MAVRVTPRDVKKIIDTDLDSEVIRLHISIANRLIDAVITGTTLSDAELIEVERWLSAHFVSVQDPRVASEKIGKLTTTFEQMKMGEGIKGTRYGQMAISLDRTGALASLGKASVSMKTYGEKD